jgi:hypothetical protein
MARQAIDPRPQDHNNKLPFPRIGCLAMVVRGIVED